MSITDGGGRYECSIALLKVKGRFILPPEAAKNNYHIGGNNTQEFISQFDKIVMSSEWGEEDTIKATRDLLQLFMTEGVAVMGANFPSTPGEACVYWLGVEFSSRKHSVKELIDLVAKGLSITNMKKLEVTIF